MCAEQSEYDESEILESPVIIVLEASSPYFPNGASIGWSTYGRTLGKLSARPFDILIDKKILIDNIVIILRIFCWKVLQYSSRYFTLTKFWSLLRNNFFSTIFSPRAQTISSYPPHPKSLKTWKRFEEDLNSEYEKVNI